MRPLILNFAYTCGTLISVTFSSVLRNMNKTLSGVDLNFSDSYYYRNKYTLRQITFRLSQKEKKIVWLKTLVKIMTNFSHITMKKKWA
jgi:hypothetical protein